MGACHPEYPFSTRSKLFPQEKDGIFPYLPAGARLPHPFLFAFFGAKTAYFAFHFLFLRKEKEKEMNKKITKFNFYSNYPS